MPRLSKKTIEAVQRYGPSVDAIAKQYGVSGAALLAKLVEGESGDNPNAVSPAGAKGRAQFMPSSRQTAVSKYGVDPWSQDPDQAVHAAALHLRGLINGSKGLTGYNPGDPSYTGYILGQKVGDVAHYGNGGSSGPGVAAPATTRTVTTPGVSQAPLRRQLVQSFLQQGGVKNSSAVAALAGQYGQAADTPPTMSYQAQPQVKVRASSVTKGPVPLGGSKNAGKGSFDVSGPDPGRLKPELTSFARKVAEVFGGPLVGLDGSTHSKLTVNGNVSEHYTGNATDIFQIGGKPAQGATLLRAGRAALIAAGMPRAEALKAQGGLYNVGNHQIIFLTNEGGNHFDHLHISTHAK